MARRNRTGDESAPTATADAIGVDWEGIRPPFSDTFGWLAATALAATFPTLVAPSLPS